MRYGHVRPGRWRVERGGTGLRYARGDGGGRFGPCDNLRSFGRGPLCLLFATTYPEKVEWPVLFGTIANFANAEATSAPGSEALVHRRLALALFTDIV